MIPKNVLERIALRLRNELVIAAPSDKGRLRSSIKVFPTTNGLRVKMVEHGKFVEFGTPPHVIRPKNKKALAFKVGGENIIVKEVHHPGTRPNPFIRTTINTKLVKIIEEEMSR